MVSRRPAAPPAGHSSTGRCEHLGVVGPESRHDLVECAHDRQTLPSPVVPHEREAEATGRHRAQPGQTNDLALFVCQHREVAPSTFDLEVLVFGYGSEERPEPVGGGLGNEVLADDESLRSSPLCTG